MGSCFIHMFPKKSQFPEVLLIAQFPPILFLEELNIGTVKYLTTISGALLTTLVQTCPYNSGSITTLC